ncbi:unnamed protein product [Linum trigynum]|uniref:RNA 3'-terminal phosphate cyclase domain-containing protein n=1 Tax=Linum trigynum TaxID=586398 RepID=A0AAV2G4S3_9ROSI
MKGSQNLRQRLLLSTLSGTPILVEDIRADDKLPGLRPHEISLLRLFDRVTDDCVVEINDTGTKFKYKPGVVMGGRRVAHDCGVSRAIGYFLEPLIVLGLFGKKPLEIRLKGITNDSKDQYVDIFRSTTLPILRRFGFGHGQTFGLSSSRGLVLGRIKEKWNGTSASEMKEAQVDLEGKCLPSWNWGSPICRNCHHLLAIRLQSQRQLLSKRGKHGNSLSESSMMIK